MLLLHVSHAVGWTTWHLEPTALGLALVILGLYMYSFKSSSTPVPAYKPALFLAGWGIMLLSLISPLDAAAHRLLAFHMLQHVGLTTLGPPLVLLGLPSDTARLLLRIPLMGKLLGLATMPVIAGSLFLLNMWIWHVPPVYEQALNHVPVHVLLHVTFMATGICFWWPVIQPVPERDRMGEGGRLLYLFVSGFPMGLLALLLVASPGVIYHYYDAGPDLWGISAMSDQQVAGIIMGSLGEIAGFGAMTFLFFRFLDREEATSDAAQRERKLMGPA